MQERSIPTFSGRWLDLSPREREVWQSSLKRYLQQSRTIEDVSYEGAIVEDLNVPGITFRRCVLRGVKFVRCHLANARFSDCVLEDAQFVKAKLPHLVVDDCSIHNASFAHAYMPGARFSRTRTSSPTDEIIRNLSMMDLDPDTLYHILELLTDSPRPSDEGDCLPLAVDHASSGISFRGATLRNATLTRLGAPKADFSGADLTNADLVNADIRGADFTSAGLTGANLRGAHCEQCRFDYGQLDGINLEESYLLSASFRGVSRETEVHLNSALVDSAMLTTCAPASLLQAQVRRTADPEQIILIGDPPQPRARSWMANCRSVLRTAAFTGLTRIVRSRFHAATDVPIIALIVAVFAYLAVTTACGGHGLLGFWLAFGVSMIFLPLLGRQTQSMYSRHVDCLIAILRRSA